MIGQGLNQPAKLQYVTLTGTFSEMGAQYATQLSEKLVTQKNINDAENIPQNPAHLAEFNQFIQQYLANVEKLYPPELLEFFQGAANSEAAKNLGLTYPDFIKLDQALLISDIAYGMDQTGVARRSYTGACSFLAMRNQQGVGMARNFDWPKPYVHVFTSNPIILTLNYQGPDKANYPKEVTTVTWAGGISPITVFNENSLQMSINSAGGSVKGTIDFDRPIYFAQMLMGMMKLSTFEELKKWVKTTPADFPLIVNISSDYQMASAEVLPTNAQAQGDNDNFKNRIRKPESVHVITPGKDKNPNFIAATNKYRKQKWTGFLGQPPTEDENFCSEERYDNVVQAARNSQQRFDNEGTALDELCRQFENSLTVGGGPTVDFKCDNPSYGSKLGRTSYTVAYKYNKTTGLGEGRVRFQQPDSQTAETAKWTRWNPFKIKPPKP